MNPKFLGGQPQYSRQSSHDSSGGFERGGGTSGDVGFENAGAAHSNQQRRPQQNPLPRPPQSLPQSGYPLQNSGAGGEGGARTTGFAPTPPRKDANGTVRRGQTVRGAVRGTTREAGDVGMGRQPTRALTRGKTLTRPDRFVAPAPLINPGNARGGNVQTRLVNGVPTLTTRESFWDPWGVFINVVTCWAPRALLRQCGLKDKFKQRAWKEKVALCMIAAFLGGIIGFVTIGLTRVLCPVATTSSPSDFFSMGTTKGYVGINGVAYQTSPTTPASLLAVANSNLSASDVTDFFERSSTPFPSCAGTTARYATTNLCASSSSSPTCLFSTPTTPYLASLGLTNKIQQVGYDWSQLALFPDFLVIDGNVLNLTPYMLSNPNPIANDIVDTAIRYVLKTLVAGGGRDATRLFYTNSALKAAVPCLIQRYYAGHIGKISPGCFVSNLFLYVSLTLILGIIFARFFMAIIFKWVLSSRLILPPKNLKRHVISPAVMPEGANIDVGNTTGAAPWTNQAIKREKTQRLMKNTPGGVGKGGGGVGGRRGEKSGGDGGEGRSKEKGDGVGELAVGNDGMISMASIGAELFCVCLVTCYSEGEEGIRSTLDSIAGSNYSDARKLLFIVCDGMITGSGEKRSTPDVCVSMIEADQRFGEPQAMSYVAIGDGSQAHNMAMVYAGHYTNVQGHRTATIVVVKCGTPEEASEKKPGNRGKRDSQMILMNFFARVTYNERMCPLDYDLFRKTQSLMGVTPDFFEVCLMVDADTKIYPDSLGYLVRTMQNDNLVMGVCGETRIANKRQSWVTAIQVFEYFISHHLNKAFESVFGGVSCLPGCFSMYRLKARKQNEGDWFPVLVQPQIISEYSQSVVTTLHQKNLLLLGEDRFLTTLLLRTFPNRKMMFCPQARCRTVAPDTFKILLSQRRRWINSTVHNLMELVLVRNLCGTFCFSMQFVVFIDLIGTVVLPVAICLTYYLVISYIFNPPSNFSDAIPLLLLGAVLGLPAVLILLTTAKIVYVGWMLIYLIALPVWNFILPVYAFSKFDDFSWGETRKVDGEVKGEDAHGVGTGIATAVPLRRWEDWERSRLRKIKRDELRKREFEKKFGSRLFYGGNGLGPDRASSYEDSVAPSDSASMTSYEDDRWGMHFGAYTEDGPSMAPPPVGLYPIDDAQSEFHETIEAGDLELALEQGWEEEDAINSNRQSRQYGAGGSAASHRGSYAPPTRSQYAPAPPQHYSLSDTHQSSFNTGLSSSSYSQGPSSSTQHLLQQQPSFNSLADSYQQVATQEPYSPPPVPGQGLYSPGGNGSQGSFSFPVAPSIYPSAVPVPAENPGVSSGFERGGYGHAKQRSASGTPGAATGDVGDRSNPSAAWAERERDTLTPSPSREWERAQRSTGQQEENARNGSQGQGQGQSNSRRIA